MRPAATSLVDACIVMPQSGVMSAPPSGKSSVSVSAPLVSVPLSVPFFCLWHEPHEPSLRLAESSTADPVSVVPVCVSVHLNVSAPCASLPVPVHAPVRFAADDVAVVVVPLGADGVDAGEPQPANGRSSAARNSGAMCFTTIRV